MFRVRVNGVLCEVRLSQSGEGNNFTLAGEINGTSFAWDVARVGKNRFHLLAKERGYRIEVQEDAGKPFRVTVNGHCFDAMPVDHKEELFRALDMERKSERRLCELRAPMPGLLLSVCVKAGENVCAGDPLLVLEAMKMENIVRAHAGGRVTQILVEKGQKVEKDQLLLTVNGT